MVYKYTSCEPIIADLLGRIKMTDSNYADDLLIWLAQGLNMLRVYTMLQPAVCEIKIQSHTGELPCGLVNMDGIYYNGYRLRLGTGVIDTRVCKDSCKVKDDYDSYFVSDPTDEGYINNSQDYRLIRGLDLKHEPCNDGGADYYIPYPNHIQTSFKEGKVVLFYEKMATDKRGYPLIPEEENIRYALFWWLMAQLTLSGYKHADPSMDYSFCEAKFASYGRIGKNKMKYWSVDKRQAVLEMTVNLIPPHGYYERFFNGGEQPKSVRK
jgi:hypothetical protein